MLKNHSEGDAMTVINRFHIYLTTANADNFQSILLSRYSTSDFIVNVGHHAFARNNTLKVLEVTFDDNWILKLTFAIWAKQHPDGSLHLNAFPKCVSKIKDILSVIHYTIYGAVCFQFTNFPCDDWENIYTLSYYNHQIGNMNYHPLFRVRSWNNGVRFMSFYIITMEHLYTKWYKNLNKLYAA